MKRNFITLILLFVIVVAFAQNPPPLTIASQTCGTVVLEVGTPPSALVYYWQGTSCGTSKLNSALTDTVTVSDTYYLRYYNVAGDSWGSCSEIDVTVPIPPAVPAITINMNILSYIPPSPSQANVIYLWQGSVCGKSLADTSSSYIASSVGVWYLTAYDTIGKCWSDSCTAATVVGQNEYQIGANIYPNPSNGLFSVELERTESNVELKVYDLFGRVIYSETFSSFEKEAVDLSNYAKGMYILNLKNKSFTLSKQMIIE